MPGWVWLAAAAILAWVLLRRGAGSTLLSGTGPIQPGHNGSPDKTAQNPKVVPFRG